MADLFDFDDFQFKPHFDHEGNLKGFTQKDILGAEKYFDHDGSYKGYKLKNKISDQTDYYDSSNKHLGVSVTGFGTQDFLKSDGTLSHTPKLFELKDPNFHSEVHKYFSNYRSDLLNKIR